MFSEQQLRNWSKASNVSLSSLEVRDGVERMLTGRLDHGAAGIRSAWLALLVLISGRLPLHKLPWHTTK
jgi:hypothetical protein